MKKVHKLERLQKGYVWHIFELSVCHFMAKQDLDRWKEKEAAVGRAKSWERWNFWGAVCWFESSARCRQQDGKRPTRGLSINKGEGMGEDRESL